MRATEQQRADAKCQLTYTREPRGQCCTDSGVRCVNNQGTRCNRDLSSNAAVAAVLGVVVN